jgi:uncharacterized glyoxalase superfamily protein PhnB
VNLGHVQMFLRRGEPNPEGCVLYFMVDDLDTLHEFHRQNGIEFAQEPADHEWGIRDYVVRDLYGHYLLFGKHLLRAQD